MGFMDKVKETAGKAGDAAKKGTAQVKDKVHDSQLQKKADEDARQIGYLVAKEKNEGVAPPAGEIDRLAKEIADYQREIAAGPAQTEGAQAAPPEQPTSSEPTSGDFKLD